MALLAIMIPHSSLITSWWPSHFISLTVLPPCCLRPCCLSFTPFLQVPLSYCLNSFCCCLPIVAYHPPLELLSAVYCLLSIVCCLLKQNQQNQTNKQNCCLLSVVCCLLKQNQQNQPNNKNAVCCLLKQNQTKSNKQTKSCCPVCYCLPHLLVARIPSNASLVLLSQFLLLLAAPVY